MTKNLHAPGPPSLLHLPHLRDDVTHPGGPVFLDRNKRLTRVTKVASVYEGAMRDVFIRELRSEQGIGLFYELPFEVPAFNGVHEGPVTLIPDFTTTLTVGGRNVVFEVHPKANVAYKIRLQRLKESHGNSCYFILVTPHKQIGNGPEVQLDFEGESVPGYVDERWRMPKIRVKQNDPDWKSSMSKKDYKRWDGMFTVVLAEFVEHRVDRGPIRPLLRPAS